MTTPDGPTPEQRAAFRAFVRDHHPDRGGDPRAFAEGVARYRKGLDAQPAPQATADPVPAGGPLPFPVRVGVALIRTWRRRHEGS